MYTYVFLQALAEHLSDVPAFGVESAETLGPADEFAVIDALLPIQPRESRILGTQSDFGNDTTYEHGYEN